MDRRGFVRVAAAGVLGGLCSRPAEASLSRAVRLEELTLRSRHVLLGEALEAQSTWERVGKRRHIVTYTRVRPLEVLAGSAPSESELLVRTLGGRVGDLGELVHGEALIGVGERGVLFITPAGDALTVTAMAQGHYPLVQDAAGNERLRRSPEARELLREEGAAVQRLPGLLVGEARTLLRQVVQP